LENDAFFDAGFWGSGFDAFDFGGGGATVFFATGRAFAALVCFGGLLPVFVVFLTFAINQSPEIR
jgi:hypothetical protein